MNICSLWKSLLSFWHSLKRWLCTNVLDSRCWELPSILACRRSTHFWLVTVHNIVAARSCYYSCDSVHSWGCLTDPPPGRAPWADTSMGRHLHGQTPPPPGRHPLWADTTSHQTTTAADGTHPTGMHSCFNNGRLWQIFLVIFWTENAKNSKRYFWSVGIKLGELWALSVSH